jgi:hypothetical protein
MKFNTSSSSRERREAVLHWNVIQKQRANLQGGLVETKFSLFMQLHCFFIYILRKIISRPCGKNFVISDEMKARK